MNIADAFSAVMKKYHLMTPMPPEVKRKLFISKKASLKYILSANKSYSFSVKSTMSVFYAAMKLGFNLSVNGSRILVRAGSFAAVILIVASVALVTKPYLYHIPPAAAAICTSGDAAIKRHGKEGMQLKPTDIIKKGDIITTGPDSFAIIQIGKDKMIRIQPNTKIEIASVTGTDIDEINIRTGIVLCSIKKLEKDESFSIRSASAIAIVHGTAFSFTCTESGCTVAVKEGSVELIRIEPSHSIIVNGGFAASADNAMDIRKITAAEKLEIQRMESVPIQDHPDSLNDAEKSGILERVQKSDKDIDRKIGSLKAETLPQTIEEIRGKYGRIDVITTFNGKSFKGAIISRGKTWKILVPGRYINIPSNTIQSTTNVP